MLLSILKKLAIHKKTTGYSLWKFWFSILKKITIHKKQQGTPLENFGSLFSRNSQFTKKQQGTPFGNFGPSKLAIHKKQQGTPFGNSGPSIESIFMFINVLIKVKEDIKRCKVCQKGSCENADLKCQVTMQSECVVNVRKSLIAQVH